MSRAPCAIKLARPAGGARRPSPCAPSPATAAWSVRQDVTFAAGSAATAERVVLPTELRNRMARLVVESQNSAGATVLFDEGWQRRPVGIIAGNAQGEEEQPLLGNTYYVERALAPSTRSAMATSMRSCSASSPSSCSPISAT